MNRFPQILLASAMLSGCQEQSGAPIAIACRGSTTSQLAAGGSRTEEERRTFILREHDQRIDQVVDGAAVDRCMLQNCTTRITSDQATIHASETAPFAGGGGYTTEYQFTLDRSSGRLTIDYAAGPHGDGGFGGPHTGFKSILDCQRIPMPTLRAPKT
ncbi:hypothetical protein [Sphingosinicella sp. BN140058]|uniref:hypothetical protein n=1 Tax=Sphingosinicella sp. BN140058 TaxID=1892855 RepID=UPI0010139E78|nr:hypothetical protein [Sphingosinicella sp. BN140058]QAY80475.1 hypothetical protein ETR14_27950 [Sphingosinicella sp. BN140058]